MTSHLDEPIVQFEPHPARDLAVASMQAVEAGDRDAWIALFASDGVVADPVGPSPFDPEGNGHRGHEAIGRFWDTTISQGDVRFTIYASYASGQECANVGTITTTLPDGSRAVLDGVFTYRVDASGKLAALRAVWEFDKLRIEPPEGADR